MAINLFTSVNTRLQIKYFDLWAMIHKTSRQIDCCGAHFNELLPPVEPSKSFVSIFSKKRWNTAGLGYLLFVSFIHHLPTTFRDSLSMIDCPTVSASLSVITISISIFHRFLFYSYDYYYYYY